MIEMGPLELAAACGGTLYAGPTEGEGPRRAIVDSRQVEAGDLFVGLTGEQADGGDFAAKALERGAWGVLVSNYHAVSLGGAGARVIGVDDPLIGLAELARAWRLRLGGGECQTVAITGSTGKTSVKDIAAALLEPLLATHASPLNLNTEVGLPLAVLGAPRDTDCLIVELAMRGHGQIRELASIALPQVGVVTNVGPVHLQLMGSVAAVVAAKAELIAALPAAGVCIVPAGATELEPYLRDDLQILTFADATAHSAKADVTLITAEPTADGTKAVIDVAGERLELELNLAGHHNVLNATIAVAIAKGIGAPLDGLVEGAGRIALSALRGEQLELPGDILLVNDCYNANPMSMAAALLNLDQIAARRAARRVAILGEMAELGAGAADYHRQVGELAAAAGVDLLIAAGELGPGYIEGFGAAGAAHAVEDAHAAAELAGELLDGGDVVLVKGSRSVGLEVVAEKLAKVRV